MYLQNTNFEAIIYNVTYEIMTIKIILKININIFY